MLNIKRQICHAYTGRVQVQQYIKNKKQKTKTNKQCSNEENETTRQQRLALEMRGDGLGKNIYSSVAATMRILRLEI